MIRLVHHRREGESWNVLLLVSPERTSYHYIAKNIVLVSSDRSRKRILRHPTCAWSITAPPSLRLVGPRICLEEEVSNRDRTKVVHFEEEMEAEKCHGRWRKFFNPIPKGHVSQSKLETHTADASITAHFVTNSFMLDAQIDILNTASENARRAARHRNGNFILKIKAYRLWLATEYMHQVVGYSCRFVVAFST